MVINISLGAMAARKTPARKSRDPDGTRQRLIEAAGAEFNRLGYHGTDSNRIARAAGYAPGSFYKHFADKRAAFLEVYAAWARREWDGLEQVLAAPTPPPDPAGSMLEVLLESHRAWRGFRASLRALTAVDPVV